MELWLVSLFSLLITQNLTISSLYFIFFKTLNSQIHQRRKFNFFFFFFFTMIMIFFETGGGIYYGFNGDCLRFASEAEPAPPIFFSYSLEYFFAWLLSAFSIASISVSSSNSSIMSYWLTMFTGIAGSFTRLWLYEFN